MKDSFDSKKEALVAGVNISKDLYNSTGLHWKPETITVEHDFHFMLYFVHKGVCLAFDRGSWYCYLDDEHGLYPYLGSVNVKAFGPKEALIGLRREAAELVLELSKFSNYFNK